MTKFSIFTKHVFEFSVLAISLVAVPWITILSINTVFGTNIIFTVYTWLGTLWLWLIISFARKGETGV